MILSSTGGCANAWSSIWMFEKVLVRWFSLLLGAFGVNAIKESSYIMDATVIMKESIA
jgi:hypothetical protein